MLDKYGITLEFPFTWELLYIASLLFVLSFILYVIFCPNFIKKYRDYSIFFEEEGKKGMEHLGDIFRHMNIEDCVNAINAGENTVRFLSPDNIYPSYTNAIHSLCRKFYFVSFLCIFLYILGILLILYTIGQSIFFSIIYIFGH